ncbi:MAG: hypothetical protein PHD61_07800 [Bacteroidales bacterium]|nr:hypothetical protein [Lentimicrobiaceae bacterium]MDD5695194.1 hypothetical protein [Bacteroidales bacterium]
MVKGLALFTDYFSTYKDSYILIGGAATDIWMEETGLPFRVTKDLDIILLIEALTKDFIKHFWEFIEEGKYKIREKSNGKPIVYRFNKPEDNEFPFQIEIFSRLLDIEGDFKEAHLTPIPVGEDLSSLSAILMDQDYYDFTRNNSDIIDGLHLATSPALLCLKVKAFLDIHQRIIANDWGHEDERSRLLYDVKKHRNDIFRIALILNPDDRIDLTEPMKSDLINFIEHVKTDPPDYKVLAKNIELAEINPERIFKQLKTTFNL